MVDAGFVAHLPEHKTYGLGPCGLFHGFRPM